MPTAMQDGLLDFFRSDSWADVQVLLDDPGVSFFEARVNTVVHPLSLEFLFVEYLDRLGRSVRNVGHAFVGEWGWIKIYPEIRPVLNVVWRYDDSSVIAAHPEDFLDVWTDEGERNYLEDVAPRRATEADREGILSYLASDHWQQVLEWFADDETEHFHTYLHTDLHPHDLAPFLVDSLAERGFVLGVPPFFLARPDLGLMWIGLAPDGMTSQEVACIHTSGALIEPKELTREDREYGGDPWTVADFRTRVAQEPYEVLTLSEARGIVDELV
ncbi:MAG: hypothetical protein OXF41_15345 [bacterium]|nr:hypothetical protein [bacterium]